MGIFSNQYVNQANQQSPERLLLSQYRLARSELLLALILTAVNVGTLLLNVNFYFLFSLAVPYYGIVLGMVFTQELAMNGFLIAGIVFAVLIFAVYVLLYILSKKKAGCLTALLVLFAIDTVAVIGVIIIASSEGGLSGVFDVVFHALVLYYLIRGVIAAKKLKALGISVDTQMIPNAVNTAPAGMPAEQTQPGTFEAAPEENVKKTVCPYCGTELEAGASFCQSCGAKLEPEEQVREQDEEPDNETVPEEPEFKTEPIGPWDGRGTVRIAAIYNGVEVKATRKFSCTELIIDGKVYDTFDKIIEVQYTLAAVVNGVKYIYAQDGFGHAVLTADGVTLATANVT
jgi:hypothetical protein